MEANILVVEDEKGIRDAITIYLKNKGYYVAGYGWNYHDDEAA